MYEIHRSLDAACLHSFLDTRIERDVIRIAEALAEYSEHWNKIRLGKEPCRLGKDTNALCALAEEDRKLRQNSPIRCGLCVITNALYAEETLCFPIGADMWLRYSQQRVTDLPDGVLDITTNLPPWSSMYHRVAEEAAGRIVYNLKTIHKAVLDYIRKRGII